MNPVELNCIKGPNLALRLVQTDDAEYIHNLRLDTQYNTHLSVVHGTADKQRKWIVDYKAREEAGSEFYYVIERHDDVRCGVVRLYGITQDSFTWGSWILDHNKPHKAALESAVLSFGVGFEILSLKHALVDVRIENERAISFYQRLKMKETNRTNREIFFVYEAERYQSDKVGYMSLLEEGSRALTSEPHL